MHTGLAPKRNARDQTNRARGNVLMNGVPGHMANIQNIRLIILMAAVCQCDKYSGMQVKGGDYINMCGGE